MNNGIFNAAMYLKSISDTEKRVRVSDVNVETSFPSTKRLKTILDGQINLDQSTNFLLPTPAPPVSQNPINAPAFFGSTSQPQHHSTSMMNPNSNPEFHAAAAASAAMTAFMAMGQTPATSHINQQQASNPMQNFMASYAQMMHGEATAAVHNNTGRSSTGPVSISNGSPNSSASPPSESLRATPPSGNISPVNLIMTRNLSHTTARSTPTLFVSQQNNFVAIDNNKRIDNGDTPLISNVNLAAGNVSPINIQGTKGSAKTKSIAANPFLNMKDLSLEELGKLLLSTIFLLKVFNHFQLLH